MGLNTYLVGLGRVGEQDDEWQYIITWAMRWPPGLQIDIQRVTAAPITPAWLGKQKAAAGTTCGRFAIQASNLRSHDQRSHHPGRIVNAIEFKASNLPLAHHFRRDGECDGCRV